MFPEPREPDQLEVGTCEVCGEGIYADVGAIVPGGKVLGLARAAMRQHLRSHTEGQILRAEMRALLPRLSAEQRASFVQRVYAQLRAEWGEQESRGVYTVEDVLGSAELYRLWQDAHRCWSAGCRHEA
jgi:hypothetical protein